MAKVAPVNWAKGVASERRKYSHTKEHPAERDSDKRMWIAEWISESQKCVNP